MLAADFPDRGQNKILSCDPTPCSKTPISSVSDKTQAGAKWRFPPFDRSDTFTLQHISCGSDGISLLVWLDLFDTWDVDENIPRSIFLIFFPVLFQPCLSSRLKTRGKKPSGGCRKSSTVHHQPIKIPGFVKLGNLAVISFCALSFLGAAVDPYIINGYSFFSFSFAENKGWMHSIWVILHTWWVGLQKRYANLCKYAMTPKVDTIRQVLPLKFITYVLCVLRGEQTSKNSEIEDTTSSGDKSKCSRVWNSAIDISLWSGRTNPAAAHLSERPVTHPLGGEERVTTHQLLLKTRRVTH